MVCKSSSHDQLSGLSCITNIWFGLGWLAEMNTTVCESVRERVCVWATRLNAHRHAHAQERRHGLEELSLAHHDVGTHLASRRAHDELGFQEVDA